VGHMELHEEKVYQCDLCPKKYSRLFYVRRHRKTHTSNRVFFCEHCSYVSKKKDLLADHLNRHFDIYPYECTECDRKFCTKILQYGHVSTKLFIHYRS
jgi:KRAB domain-containing zinc finger protein